MNASKISNGRNTTTDAYERTGIYPLNVEAEAWVTAIETLGMKTKKDDNVSFEIYPQEGKKLLNEKEKKLLREGLDDVLHKDLDDTIVAQMRCREVLAKWRETINEGVSNGKDRKDYEKTYTIDKIPLSESQMTALKLMEFRKVDVSKIKVPAEMSEEEISRRYTKNLIEMTNISEPIQVFYSPASKERRETDKVTGTAVKIEKNKWIVTLSSGAVVYATTEDLLDGQQYTIGKALVKANSTKKGEK